MRHVFSMETEREKDLQTLAETIVLCKLKLEQGGCVESGCKKCSTYAELEMCLRELPACDNLRVKNMAQGLYEQKRFQYGADGRKPLFNKEKFIKEAKEAGIAVGQVIAAIFGVIILGGVVVRLMVATVCLFLGW